MGNFVLSRVSKEEYETIFRVAVGGDIGDGVITEDDHVFQRLKEDMKRKWAQSAATARVSRSCYILSRYFYTN